MRPGLILTCAALLQGCNDDDSGGNPSGLVITGDEIAVSATPGDASPISMVTLKIENSSESVVLWDWRKITSNGVDSLDYKLPGPTGATLAINFKPPGSLPNGTYTDTVEVRACLDVNCTTQANGSPTTIRTSYVVFGEGPYFANLDRCCIQVIADSREQQARVESVRLQFSSWPPSGIFVTATAQSHNAIDYTSINYVVQNEANIGVAFVPASQLATGTYHDTVTVTACYDVTCVRQLADSPFEIPTTFTMGIEPEPGIAPLAVESRTALPHNIIDAEFSKALNQIVVVASYPANSLYIYDIATATERQQLLSRIPTSVSVSPDGLTAAVGHEKRISIVDLTSVGQPGAPDPMRLNVSIDVFDLVLAGNGYVHAFPSESGFRQLFSVEIATNTETGVSGQIGSPQHGRLHPSGDFIYSTDEFAFPGSLEKWNVADGVAESLYSQFPGEVPICNNLWFSETGATIFTPCSFTFRSSTDSAQDMQNTGSIPVHDNDTDRWGIASLSEVAARNEIALIEFDRFNCSTQLPQDGPCYTHLAFHEGDFFARTAEYSLTPLKINGVDYAQHGLFVFHDASGTKKYVLSKLDAMPNPDAEFYLSVSP